MIFLNQFLANQLAEESLEVVVALCLGLSRDEENDGKEESPLSTAAMDDDDEEDVDGSYSDSPATTTTCSDPGLALLWVEKPQQQQQEEWRCANSVSSSSAGSTTTSSPLVELLQEATAAGISSGMSSTLESSKAPSLGPHASPRLMVASGGVYATGALAASTTAPQGSRSSDLPQVKAVVSSLTPLDALGLGMHAVTLLVTLV